MTTWGRLSASRLSPRGAGMLERNLQRAIRVRDSRDDPLVPIHAKMRLTLPAATCKHGVRWLANASIIIIMSDTSQWSMKAHPCVGKLTELLLRSGLPAQHLSSGYLPPSR